MDQFHTCENSARPMKVGQPEEETPWARMDHAFRTVITVPKAALLKEEARLKRLKQRKRAKKKPA